MTVDTIELRLKRKKLSFQERLEMYTEAFPLKTEEEKIDEAQWQNFKPEGRERLLKTTKRLIRIGHLNSTILF